MYLISGWHLQVLPKAQESRTRSSACLGRQRKCSTFIFHTADEYSFLYQGARDPARPELPILAQAVPVVPSDEEDLNANRRRCGRSGTILYANASIMV